MAEPGPVKLSSPATKEFWEIPVLWEDADLFIIDKPAGLPVSPDSDHPDRPSLLALIHRGIERGAPWAVSRQLGYLMNAHRVDAEAGGVLVLVKNKPALVNLAAQFATHEPSRSYAALVRGTMGEDAFATDAKLAPHPLRAGVMKIDEREGKRSHTDFSVRERFKNGLLLECRPVPDRSHQVRVHLKNLRLPVVGDGTYGGQPLLLSSLKPDYRLKGEKKERPLMDHPALHLEQVKIAQPTTSAPLTINSPIAKAMMVSIKYLRRYAPAIAAG